MKTKNVLKKLLGGALAFVMALGIFAGTGIEAKAEGNWEFVSVSPTEETLDAFIAANDFVDYYDGAFTERDIVEILALLNANDSVYIIGKAGDQTLYCLYQESDGFVNDAFYANNRGENVSWYILKRKSSSPSGSATPVNIPWYYEKITLSDYNESSLYDTVGQHGLTIASLGEGLAYGNDVQNKSVCIVDSYKLDDETYVFFYYVKDDQGQVRYDGRGIDDSATTYAQMEEATGYNFYILKPKNTESSHTHSYSWVPVQEATVRQAGIAEYRCSCGDVQGRSVIPASTAAVKGLINEIENAPQNETAAFDTGWLYTISDHIIKKLAERTDITTVITFEYQNQAYKMTIPAGADFTSLLADEEYFYGYFFFANAVGATIEAL